MTFAAPWALLLLIPWLATALYVLLATREVAYVPFVRLWPKSEATQQARRSVHRPPLWVVGVLLAMLLAILAAAGLGVRTRRRSITVIVDCGVSMSAKGRVDSALAPLKLTSADTLHVIPIPGEPFDVAGDKPVDRLIFTADDTTSLLDHTLRDTLAKTAGPIVVVSDRPPTFAESAALWLRPAAPLDDVAIELFSVTPTTPGKAQAMVRIFNGTERTSAGLIGPGVVNLHGPTGFISPKIDLPPRGQRRDFFFDIDYAADVEALSVEILIDDAIRADNSAYLVRDRRTPAILPDAALSPSQRRMIDIYAAHRGPADPARKITVAPFPLPPDRPGVWLAAGGSEKLPRELNVTSHPVTRSVDWPAIAADATGGRVPGDNWKALFGSPNAALLAVREAPVRQVWVGFDIDAFSNWSDYVVLWTNVLDWVGDGSQGFVAEAAGESKAANVWITADASVHDSPGVYSHADGSKYAVAPPVLPPAKAQAAPDTSSFLRSVAAVRPLSSYLSFLALGIFALSLAGRGRLT